LVALQMARELDDAILTLRASELDLGLWIIKTAGNRTPFSPWTNSF